ncbi:hypothetical protein BDW02DRAFT_630879 [Decorospora gaudefroyi]|uniref:Structure-specific endonuclease subunit SLX4 n=1 Tax=Decorospora gaudefroyi TaxID=184978 RepID=A0A6A5KDW6_9PLEO|nr:hypothetical protein BDW02DRAFT_630879 [Decorospora gaudefroyi]
MAGHMYEVVVLSSSPPAASPPQAPSSRRVAMPPLSPLAFSPPASPLRPTTGASKPNRRVAPIPEGAVRGFATVGSLVRSEHFTSRLDDGSTESIEIQAAQERRGSLDVTEETTVAIKKPQKRAAKKAAADGLEKKPKPKPRARKPKPKSDKEIADSDDELRRPPLRPTKSPFFNNEETAEPAIETADAPKLTKSGKPRKPRAKKQKVEDVAAEAAAEPKKTSVAKSKSGKAGKTGKAQRAPKSVEAQETVTGDASIWDIPQSPCPEKKSAPKQRLPDPVAEGLELEEAVLRRQNWTPPRNTAIPLPMTHATDKENRTLTQNADGTFTTLVSNFAYAQPPSAQITGKAASSTTELMAATKRRRIELVEILSNRANSRDSSPEKGKAPKKKPRTITDLVTEQYAPKDTQSAENVMTSSFFEPRTTVTNVPFNDTSAAHVNTSRDKPARKRNPANAKAEQPEPKTKSKRASGKAVKPKPVAEKLLSPASALLRLNKQEVLFGTSSQLALDESPTMVRQLQLAIKESEQDAISIDARSMPPPSRWPRLGKVQGKRSLWAASSRDDQGGMLEHTEDVYLPAPDRTQDIPLLMDGTNDAPDALRCLRKETHIPPSDLPSFIDIDDTGPDPSPVVIISSDLPTPPRTISEDSLTIKPMPIDHQGKRLEFEDIANFEQEAPPSNQNADTFVDIEEFDFPPSAQMRTSPAKKFVPPPSVTNGSPTKRRGRKPKSQSAIPDVTTSSTRIPKPLPSKQTSKTKATPSPPPKGSARFIDIDEIMDSEDDALEALSPTPPRVLKHADSTPLPLISLSAPIKKPSKAKAKPPPATPVLLIPQNMLEWSTIKPHIFAKITSHIRSLPPTTNPAQLSWHEKILMYEPIIIDTFTAYLNAQTSIRTYRKATKIQVKAWQKESGKAEEREGEVWAVEKELEPSMVQTWCESLSVCCIWGEGRGRGKNGGRKGLY